MLTIKKRAGKLFVFLLAVTALFAGCTPRGQRALLEGKKLIERGHFNEAIGQLQLATTLIGTNAQVWNYLGLAYHYSGQSTNAVKAYHKALELDHDLIEARFNLGCLWLEENRLDAARMELTAYTLRRDNSTEGWTKLGTAQFRSRDLASAEKSFNEAMRANPQNAEAMNALGVINVQRNRPREAAEFFSNALKQRPDYPPALLNLAIVAQIHLNNHSLALEKYEEYLALAGHSPNSEAVIAVTRVLEQELAAASRPASANQPAPAPVARPVAAPPRPASNAVSRTAPPAPRPAPPTPPPAQETVRVSPEPVIRPAQDSVPAPGPDTAPRTQRDNRPASSGARAETPKASSVIGQSSTGPRYHYHSMSEPVAGDRAAAERALAQGVQAQQSDRMSDAFQAYRQAAQLDPTYYEAYYNQGLAAVSAGFLPQALTAYENALALRPDSLDARYNFALALKKANFPTDAANELEKLLVTYPNEPRAHLALANLCAQQLQQPIRARLHYLKVLEIDPRNPQAGNIRDWLQANPL